MKETYIEAKIIENIELKEGNFKIVLEGNFQGEAGQFYMIRGWDGMDPYLARPMSISNIEDGNLVILYQLVGRGTQIISRLKPGDSLSVFGPLGNSYKLEDNMKVALVGGGTGIAPMLYLSKKLSKLSNVEVDLYLGFRDSTYYLEEYKNYVDNIYISTESGSKGHKGYIIDILDPKKYDKIYSCGPNPMLKSLIKKTDKPEKIEVSLESKMACGIGICYGCTVELKSGLKKVCKDGPIFLGSELILNVEN